MDRYAYLLLSLAVLAVYIAIWVLRPHLRRTLLKMGLLGAVLGPLSEYWYFVDYWRPPSLFGTAVYSFEDVLFGLAMLGIAATIHDAVFGTRDSAGKRPARWRIYLVILAIGVLSILLFTNLLSINSIVVSGVTWFVLALIMMRRRPDLIRVSVLSGILCAALILPIYVALFHFAFPEYWKNYWLLYGSPLGLMIGNGVPVTELVWYATIGMFASIVLPYASGSRKEHAARIR